MIVNGYYKPIELFNALRYYDPEKDEVTGSATFGIVVSNRTGGKTVNVAIELLRRYLENGSRSMILCRYGTEKKGGKGNEGYCINWWNKVLNVDDAEGFIKSLKENHKIEVTVEGLYIDGEIASYCEALTDSVKIKNNKAYDRCCYIVMDEAIQEGERFLLLIGTPAMTHILRIYQTVARGWDHALESTSVIFLSNIDERDNWLFNDLKLNEFIKSDTKRTVQNDIYYERFINENVKKQLLSSGIGRIMQRSESGQRYFIGSVLNAFTDNDSFVKRAGLDFKKLVIQIIIKGKCIGIFKTDYGYHCAKIEEDKRSRVITDDTIYHTENNEYEQNSEWREVLSYAYMNNLMTFQTQETKNLVISYMRV